MNCCFKGNVNSHIHKNRGWVIGHFVESSNPLHNKNFEVKWVKNKAGRVKENLMPGPNNQSTLVVLIKGKILLEVLNKGEKIELVKEGDYAFYRPIISHRTTFLEDSHIIVIRWPSCK